MINKKIQDNFNSLTKSEKKIADYVLKHNQQVVHATMHDIKEATSVGDATIIRFCQKLGFSGFTDLKIEIAKDNLSSQYFKSGTQKYYSFLLEQLIQTLNNTQALFQEAKIHETIQYMQNAKRIFIFGVGSSGITALDFESMLLRVGLSANAVIDPHYQTHIASIVNHDDLIFAISLSGKTKDVFDSVEIAKNNQAKIIALTNYLHTPIAQISDVVLQTAYEEFIDGASVAGKLSQLFVLDVLVHSYEHEFDISSENIREKILRSILDKRIEEF